MKSIDELKKLIEEGGKLFLPNLSADIVIFGYDDQDLKILLLEITDGKWMVPGGYILTDEDLDNAAKRVLYERTGLKDVYLKQFYTFGKSGRTFGSEIKQLFEANNLPWNEKLWINNRFVSVGYYSLVEKGEVTPVAGYFSHSIRWFSLNELPNLLLDHSDIINKALVEFQQDLRTHPVACQLLPDKFTMPELHRVYETVLQKKMDRSRFQKKMFEYNVFQRLEERREGVPHKRPYLYMYKG